jgi:excinuclease ABC subunit C
LRVIPRSDDPDAVVLYGPFRRVAMLRDAIRVLAELTGLRDCTLDQSARGASKRRMWFEASTPRARRANATDAGATQRPRVPGCLRRDLGTCPGPCVGEGDAKRYAASVAVARAFLDGLSDAPLADARRTMLEASERLEFERAASLRDRIERLAWLHERLQRFHASVDRLTFRYHAIGHDQRERVYLVRRGTVRADLPAPTTDDEAVALEQLAAQIYDGPDPSGADIPTHDMDEFYLVASWFRRRPDEKARTKAALRTNA